MILSFWLLLQDLFYNKKNLLSTKYGYSIFKIIDSRIIQIDSHYKSVKCEDLIAVRDTDSFLKKMGFKPTAAAN